jgi:hypothetical protein
VIWYQLSFQPEVGCSPTKKKTNNKQTKEEDKKKRRIKTHFVISISKLITEPAPQPKDE